MIIVEHYVTKGSRWGVLVYFHDRFDFVKVDGVHYWVPPLESMLDED